MKPWAILTLLAAATGLGAAAPELPSGAFVLVAARAPSDTAMVRPAPDEAALAKMMGRGVQLGAFGPWLDGAPCAGAVREAAEPRSDHTDPILSDLQIKADPNQRLLNRSLVIDCGARPGSSIHPALQIDRRVLVTLSPNGGSYLILEAPLAPEAARKVEAGLKTAGLDPGPVDGVIDAASRRALGLYARKKGAAFAFGQGVLTENLVADLSR